MENDAPSGAFFADALEDRKDITDQYEVLGDLPDLVGVSTGEEDRIVEEICNLIEEEGGGMHTIVDLGGPPREDAVRLYHEDLIAGSMAPMR